MSVALFAQCASSAHEDIRRVSWGLQNGWHYYVDTHIWPFIDWHRANFSGSPKILLHNPFGFKRTKDAPVMSFLQFSEAVHDRLTFFYKEFAAAIKPITRLGYEVIAYIGSPHNSNTLKRMAARPSSRDNILYHVWKNTRPLIDAGCSLAFDNMASLGRTPHPFSEQTMFLIQSLGAKTYVEATPERDPQNDSIWNENYVITEKLFKNRHSERQHPGVKGRFPRYDDKDFYEREGVVLFNWRKHTLDYRDMQKYGAKITPAIPIGLHKEILNGAIRWA